MLSTQAIAKHSVNKQCSGQHAGGEEEGGDRVPLVVPEILQMLEAPKRRFNGKPSQSDPIGLGEGRNKSGIKLRFERSAPASAIPKARQPARGVSTTTFPRWPRR